MERSIIKKGTFVSQLLKSKHTLSTINYYGNFSNTYELTVSIHKFYAIKDVDNAQWDNLVRPNPMALSGWLKTLEETYSTLAQPIYFKIEEENILRGAAVTYLFLSQSNFDSIHSNLFGRGERFAKRIGLSFYPMLECKLLVGFGVPVFINHNEEKEVQTGLIEQLISHIEDEAGNHGAFLVFSRLQQNEDDEIGEILRRRGYAHSMNLPICYMDIQWSTFTEYKKFVQKKRGNNYKRNIVKEINRAKRFGLQFHSIHEDQRLDLQDLHRLLELNYQKYNSSAFPYNREFLKQFIQNLGDQGDIQYVSKKGQVEGVQLEVVHSGHANGPMVGIDHDLSGNDKAYFNLCYYYSIRNAIRNKYSRIYCGSALYEAKYRRGFEIMKLFDFYKTSPTFKGVLLKICLWIHRNWYRIKFSEVLN